MVKAVGSNSFYGCRRTFRLPLLFLIIHRLKLAQLLAANRDRHRQRLLYSYQGFDEKSYKHFVDRGLEVYTFLYLLSICTLQL